MPDSSKIGTPSKAAKKDQKKTLERELDRRTARIARLKTLLADGMIYANMGEVNNKFAESQRRYLDDLVVRHKKRTCQRLERIFNAPQCASLDESLQVYEKTLKHRRHGRRMVEESEKFVTGLKRNIKDIRTELAAEKRNVQRLRRKLKSVEPHEEPSNSNKTPAVLPPAEADGPMAAEKAP